MQYLVVVMILVAMLCEYFVKTLHLPRELALIPEGVSVIALLVVIVRLPRNRFQDIDPRYIGIFLLLLFHIIAGIVVNHEEPGVVVSAMRIYFKAVPIFVLALLIPISEKNLRWQLLLVAALCLIQFPIAWEQRQSGLFRGSLTGDRTVGTLAISSNLSVFLCCTASVAMAMYMKKRISLLWLIFFLAATLPATMINETKATLFIAPLALMIPAFYAGGQGAFKRNALTLLLVAGFLCAFVPTYDYYIEKRWGYGLIEFFQMQGRLSGYLDKGSELGSKEVGRVDALVLPFVAAKHDPVQIAMGLGAGNVSRSSLGPQFSGANYVRYGGLIGPTASYLLWEIGVLGLVCVLWLLFMIFRDSLVARKAEGLHGALGLGWVGVSSLMGLTMFYNYSIESIALSYLFWFYSGVVVATAMRVRREAKQPERITSEGRYHRPLHPEPTFTVSAHRSPSVRAR